MQSKMNYPFYISPVESTDEYNDDGPTHCGFQARPSTILLITWYILLARLLHFAARQCSEVRFTFTHDLHWYNTIDDAELLDKEVVEFIENGGGSASPEIMQSFIEQEGLCGYELQISPSGFLSMVCYSKFGSTEYFSENSIVFYDLLPALTIQFIKDEIMERVIRPLYKAFTLMEME
jgi:hypothetical protein